MTAPPVSVIIVSRGRPGELALCLIGVSQQYYPNFEIVVVTDPAGAATVAHLGWADRIKVVPFDVPNIAMARNLGIGAAAGRIVAFIDDDAVPEPTWLSHLTAPIASGQAVAAGGYVRGRNGISFQWRGRDVGPDGTCDPLELPSDAPLIRQGTATRGTKTEGTNMAFDRETLAAMGGFDPAFAFYLDETDVNMRLAIAGHATAIVPLAQVHHGYSASPRRRADRVPLDLSAIGRSLAVYLRRHMPDGDHDAVFAAEVANQRRRLLSHMVAGRLDPRDVGQRLAGLHKGWTEGLALPLPALPPLAGTAPAFRQFGARAALGQRSLSGRGQTENARALVERGYVVTIYQLSATALYHRVTFTRDGIWLQRGGIYGRSDRGGPLVRFWRRAARIRAEENRVSAQRDLPHT